MYICNLFTIYSTTQSVVHAAPPPKEPLVVERLQDVQAVEQIGEIRLQVVIHGDPAPKVSIDGASYPLQDVLCVH